MICRAIGSKAKLSDFFIAVRGYFGLTRAFAEPLGWKVVERTTCKCGRRSQKENEFGCILEQKADEWMMRLISDGSSDYCLNLILGESPLIATPVV